MRDLKHRTHDKLFPIAYKCWKASSGNQDVDLDTSRLFMQTVQWPVKGIVRPITEFAFKTTLRNGLTI